MHLFLVLLAAAVAWTARAYFHPFKPCPRCSGRRRPGGTNRVSSARRFGDCGRCGASRKVQVLGSRTVHRIARSAVRARRNRKGR